MASPRREQPENPEHISLTGITKKEQRLVCSRSWVEYLSDDKAKRLEAFTSAETRYNAFVQDKQQSDDVEVLKVLLQIKTMHPGGPQGELRLACSVSTETGEMVGEEQLLDKVSILAISWLVVRWGCHDLKLFTDSLKSSISYRYVYFIVHKVHLKLYIELLICAHTNSLD